MKKKSEPPNGYRKPNTCPWCGYWSDAAVMIEDETAVPRPGDLSFCMMCCEPSQFDREMNLKKFHIDNVKDVEEKIRLKKIKFMGELYWKANPDMSGRRDDFVRTKNKRLVEH